jgi:hypothetical protein
MLVLYLTLERGKTVDVGGVCAALLEQFPGARVTAEDSFDGQRRRRRKVLAELAQRGQPVSDPLALLADIDRKEVAHGPGKDVSIPTQAGKGLTGEVWATKITLRGSVTETDPVVVRLREFLESLQLGDVECRHAG